MGRPLYLAGAVGVGVWTFFFSELFGTSVRCTGASLGYQLASIFAGALAPIVALSLLGSVGEKCRSANLRTSAPG